MNHTLKIASQLLCLFFIQSFIVVNAQKSRIDSLENLLNRHKTIDTAKVNLLNNVAFELRERDRTKCRNYAEQAGEMAMQLHYQEGKVNSLLMMCHSYYFSDEKKSMDYAQKALAMAGKLGNQALVWKSLAMIGNIKLAMGDNKGALRAYTHCLRVARALQDQPFILKSIYNISLSGSRAGNEAEFNELLMEGISVAKELDDKAMLALLYRRVAAINYFQGNYPIALENSLAALKICEQSGDKEAVLANINAVAAVYIKLNDSEAALKMIHRGFVLSQSMGDSLRMSIFLTNIADVYVSMKNPDALRYYQKALAMIKDGDPRQKLNILIHVGEIYTDKGEFDKAQQSLDEALALVRFIKDTRTSGAVYIKMGQLYLAKKQYEQALNYGQQGLEVGKEFKYLELLRDSHKLLSDVFAVKKDFNKAYLNHVQYKILSDSVFNEKNIRQITSLESTYKIDKERHKHEMEKANQRIKIKGQKQTIYFLAITTLLVLMLTLAIYWSNKLKKKVLRLEIENINHQLESNQRAMASATLKLVQNAERDAKSVQALENIKKNVMDEGQKEVRSLISDYKFKSYSSNWEEFELMFEKVNPSFYETLNERFPTLTPNERKLCVFLKLNMSNSHIAQITFQSEDALKKARLRLRKKLGLERDTNLAGFIQTL